jgi:hypothetical protein
MNKLLFRNPTEWKQYEQSNINLLSYGDRGRQPTSYPFVLVEFIKDKNTLKFIEFVYFDDF